MIGSNTQELKDQIADALGIYEDRKINITMNLKFWCRYRLKLIKYKSINLLDGNIIEGKSSFSDNIIK